MTKFMTHLEAFLSDDAKRGRVWTDEAGYKYRNHGCILHVMETDGPDAGKWRDSLLQVAALNGAVTWADEPKTLTPQEIALHMGNGGCVADLNGYVFRLGSGSPIIETWIERERQWQSVLHDWIGERNAGFLFGCRAVPDPSQPAEQRRDWNPFGPYEDMPADVQRDIETERGHAKAESRVEYPKSSCSCMGDASCPCRRNK